MSARTNFYASGRSRRTRRITSRWASLFGERLGKKKVWKCTYCGVIGSHRRGCHYVTEGHHRDPKAVRRGFLGIRARGARTALAKAGVARAKAGVARAKAPAGAR